MTNRKSPYYEKWYETKGRAYYKQRAKLARKTKLHVRMSLYKRRCKVNPDPELTVENLKKKFGPNPCCYLTGQPIDLNDTSVYVLDHIIPISRGGTSSLANCGLTLAAANQAKNNMTPQEFVEFCRKVVSLAEQNGNYTGHSANK
jgi:5-methylcytosine-specific restriction endonuclease McrA